MYNVLRWRGYLQDVNVKCWGRWGDLNDGWTGNNVVIGDLAGVVGGQEDITLTLDTGWDGGRKEVTVGGDWDRRGHETTAEGSVDGTGGGLCGLEVDHGIERGWHTRGEGKTWESHDWELGVGLWAGDDESSGDAVDWVESERGSEAVSHWDLSGGTTEGGLMKSFGDEDGTGGGKIVA